MLLGEVNFALTIRRTERPEGEVRVPRQESNSNAFLQYLVVTSSFIFISISNIWLNLEFYFLLAILFPIVLYISSLSLLPIPHTSIISIFSGDISL